MIVLKKNKEKYSEYKSTNIDWIGNIPTGWEIKRMKNILCRYKDVVGSNSANYKVLALTLRGVVERDLEDNFGKFPETFDGYQIVKRDTLIACLFDIDVTPRIIGYVDKLGIMTSAYTSFAPIGVEILPKYYYYYILRMNMENILLHFSKSLRNTIVPGDFLCIEGIIPPYVEQQKIVKFLDEKNTLIDNIILFKKKQIDFLKEKRMTLINQSVTKGLDPDVEMIDSGIEWVGKIPKGWKVEKIKYGSTINQTSLTENENPIMEILYVDIGNVNILGIDKPESFYFSDAPSRARRKVKHGDTILGTVRTYLKAIAYMDNPISNLIVSTGFAVISPQNKFDNKYLYYQLVSESFVQKVVANSKGVSYPAINSTELGELKVVIPNIEEQKSIAKYLDDKTSRIDQTIATIQKSIDLLIEYKQSLISHVVTGKVKVF